MSLHWFTDATSGDKLAINAEYVIAVFVAKEGEVAGKTVISMINGTVVVNEDHLSVVTTVNGG